MKWRNFLVIRNPVTSAVITLIAVVMALAAWLAIHTAVSRDQAAWMLGERLRIENELNERFALYTNTLLQARALILTDKQVDIHRFRQFVDHLELGRRYPGLLGLGLAEVVSSNELEQHEQNLRKVYPDYRVHPRRANKTHIPIVALEPMDATNLQEIGYDMAVEPNRLSSMREAAEQDAAVLSGPVHLVQDARYSTESGFLLYAPVYSDGMGQPGPHRPIGYLYAPMRARDFFVGVFGPPTAGNEKVNFQMSYEDQAPFYVRFPDEPPGNDRFMTMTKLRGPLRHWTLKVLALPRAFPVYYSYFPDLVGLFFLFGAAVIIYSIQRTTRQFRVEDRYKSRLINSERRIRAYSGKLLRLNRASKSISSEINLDELLKKIALVTADVVQMPSVAIFAGGAMDDASEFSLRFHQGIGGNVFQSTSIGFSEFKKWRTKHPQGVIRSSSVDSLDISKRLFIATPPSWIVLPIVKHPEAPLGFIVAYSSMPIATDEHTFSILESLSSQIATALENSYLLTRAEEASRLKSDFLANMSHEIRTPLGAVIGYSDILSKEGLPTGERTEINQHMRRNVEQVTRIIDDILDISKIEANKMDIVPGWIDLNLLLREIRSILRMKAGAKSLATDVRLNSPVPRMIYCDEVRFKQILLNLIGNSIKFTQAGGIEVIVDHDQAKSQLRVMVEDTGCGIPKNTQSTFV